MKEVGYGEDGDVIAHRPHKLRLLAKGEGPHVPMQTVCTHYDVEAVSLTAMEGYLDSVHLLDNRADGVVEDIRCSAAILMAARLQR